ncbi:hypothetical protein [Streptomyces sp. NPDC003023]
MRTIGLLGGMSWESSVDAPVVRRQRGPARALGRDRPVNDGEGPTP